MKASNHNYSTFFTKSFYIKTSVLPNKTPEWKLQISILPFVLAWLCCGMDYGKGRMEVTGKQICKNCYREKSTSHNTEVLFELALQILHVYTGNPQDTIRHLAVIQSYDSYIKLHKKDPASAAADIRCADCTLSG